jgi:small subunit ribosomal protein S20e
MAFKDTRRTPMEPNVTVHQIQITLTSHSVNSLEKVCADLIRVTKEKNLKMKGVVHCLPRLWASLQDKHLVVKILRWESTSDSPSEIVKQITSTSIEPEVEVQVTTAHA